MNRLTDAGVLTEDRLFSTLDTRTRPWRLAGGRTVLISDTVGFIRNLPHQLVASFHATLEEALNADQQAKAPRIYLAKITPYNKGGIYWEFYLIKHKRQDLLARTLDAGGFNADNVLMLEPGSLVISNAGEGPTDRAIDRLVTAGLLSKTVIREPDGTASYYVMRRTGGG